MKHVLVIGATWPEPNSTAAGSRMMQLLEFFRNNKYKISFASAAAPTAYSAVLDQAVSTYSIELNKSSFDQWLTQLNPDLILFDRFMTEEQYGWRVAKICPDAVRILDTEDLHCLRLARQQAIKENKDFTYASLNSVVAKREIASILRCDLSLIISSFEMNLLTHHFKIDSALLQYMPFLVNTNLINVNDDFESRQHFIGIGNFLHEPNWDSVLYLKKNIWPAIRKQLPNAQMHVYGAYATEKVLQLHAPKEGFLIKGRAESVKACMTSARVCLAPLRFGAGIKGKLLDAMRYGTPSVTTGIGAEGMEMEGVWNGFIVNDELEFANAAVALYTDQERWVQAQQQGLEILKERFDEAKHTPGFTTKLHSLFLNLQLHREQNFMGAILLHDTMNSAKYMSLWIEEKNKRS